MSAESSASISTVFNNTWPQLKPTRRRTRQERRSPRWNADCRPTNVPSLSPKPRGTIVLRGGLRVLQYERHALTRADTDPEHAVANGALVEFGGQREHVAGAR